MRELAPFSLKKRNPDVLTCIANLSNDEVFTPPVFAKEMLDTLAASWSETHDGASIWSDSSVTFLDPSTKSGVFLREVVERLMSGLADEIPDIQTRVNHILLNQVFGVGITQLTSLLARRSVYCSKSANSEHSVGKFVFENEDGNIWFESMEHTWLKGKCEYCGVGQNTLDRGEELETHAYAFIHTDDIKARMAEMFGGKMQFDVIIGNPPYQLNDGGHGSSAAPIYDKFVDQAKALDPRFLVMVIPARWFAGGKGLDSFRDSMLNDNRIRSIDDFPDSSDVFPGVRIQGGVCYFLRNRDNPGGCRVTTHDSSEVRQAVDRPLLEPGGDVFIRYNEALPILKKVMALETGQVIDSPSLGVLLPRERQFASLVSARKPFGLDTTFRGATKQGLDDVAVYQNGGIGYIDRSQINKETHIIDSWKVFIPRAYGGSDAFPHLVLGKPFVGGPGVISSETYMYIGPFTNEEEARSAISYIRTRFFRFLVLLHKPSQDATRSVYTFVPTQDFSHPWSDEMLYEKYGITDDEVAFIEKMIRPMGAVDE